MKKLLDFLNQACLVACVALVIAVISLIMMFWTGCDPTGTTPLYLYDDTYLSNGLANFFNQEVFEGKSLRNNPKWKPDSINDYVVDVHIQPNIKIQRWWFSRYPFNEYLLQGDTLQYKFTKDPTMFITEVTKGYETWLKGELKSIEFEIYGLPRNMPIDIAEWLSNWGLVFPGNIFRDDMTKETITRHLSQGYEYNDLVMLVSLWQGYEFSLLVGYDPLWNCHVVGVFIDKTTNTTNTRLVPGDIIKVLR